MNDDRPHARYFLDLGAGTPGERSFSAAEAEGEERLSTPFRFEVWVTSEDLVGLDPEALAGTPAAVRIVREASLARAIRGVLTAATVTVTRRGAPELHAVIEPSFALLREKSDARVFVDRSVPDIVLAVLAEGHVEVESRLEERYSKRPYCVQLGETDFDFVSRLLSEEGIFYGFTEDGAMVLGDTAAAYDSPPDDRPRAIPFRPADGFAHETAAIHAIGARAAMGAGAFTLRDFNPEKPRLNMDVGAPGQSVAMGPEHYDFPGNYAVPSDGEKRAKRLSEAAAVAAAALLGATDEVSLAPGATFTLVDAPAGVGGDRAITGLSHSYVAGEPVSVDFTALDADTVFRPEPLPRPAPMGLLTGYVTGPAGADVHTDEMGRVKVWFPFDGRSPKDESASSFLPVLQDNTGHSLGIPRVGWEVLVGFLEGDPDRPVVLGRVYNGADPFPEPLPANKTVSTLRSLSSPSRAGHNEIRLEDRASKEQIFVQAEKDQRVVVAKDRTEKVAASEKSAIGGSERISIGENQTVKIDQIHALSVGRDETIEIGGNRERTALGPDSASVAGNATLTVGAGHQRRIKGTDAVNAGKIQEKIAVLDLEASLKKNSTTAANAMALTAGGALIEVTAGDKKESVRGLRRETIGGLLFTKSGAEVKIRADGGRRTRVGGFLRVKAKQVTIKGEKKLHVKAPLAKLQGTKTLTLTVGKTVVVLSEDIIAIHAEGEIVFEATGKSGLAAPQSDTIFVGGKSVSTAGTGHAGLSEQDPIYPEGKPPATPYLNIARSKDLVPSTSRTFLNGHPVWTEQGRIAKSEATPTAPGTGERSGTWQSDAVAFATFPNVFIEGQRPIRLGDPTIQNHGNCQGRVVTGPQADQAVKDWIARMQEAMRRGLHMRVAGADGGGFADGGREGRGLAGAGLIALASQRGGAGGEIVNAANTSAAKPCECGALLIWAHADDLDFGVFARQEAQKLSGKYGGRVKVQDVRTRFEFFNLLASWSGPPIAELHIFSHSGGAALYLDHGGPIPTQRRADMTAKLQYYDRAAHEWKIRQATFDEVMATDVDMLFTDNFLEPQVLARQGVIQSKLCRCQTPFAKIWGCNSGIAGHVYSDDPPTLYYWRALNERNMPKPAIAQVLADYLGITVEGARSGSHIEVEVGEGSHKKWITPEEYKRIKGKKPPGNIPHRLEPDAGGYHPYRPSNAARPGAPGSRRADSGSDTVIFEA